MTTKNFVAKNGVTTGNIVLDAATGNLTSTNANLGNAAIANFFIGNFQGNFQVTGSNTQVLFNDQGNANASAAFTFDKSTNTVAISNALSVTANANVGNLGTSGLIVATGNVSGGNLTTIGVVSATGNVTGGNLGTSGLIVATGNVSGGNLTTIGVVSATGNVTGGNLVTGGVLNVTGTGLSSIGGNLDMTSNNIVNLATPVNSTDAATKQYVDDIAQGLHTHDSCNAATQTTLASISGGTITYNNGTSGVGATLTTTGTYTTIDGVTLADGMRILVKNEATQANNGIYVRTSATVLTRADDFDTPTEMAGGDFTFVTAGTLYDNTGWVMTDPVTTVGTSPVIWVQFSGAGTYTAGTGLTLTGSQFSVNASQTQITSVGTLTGLDVNGIITGVNITANSGIFTGNGSGLSAISGANVTGAVSFATTANAVAGANVSGTVPAATTAGTVTTNAQGNITSVGTLTSLSVTGNISAGNVSATTFTGALSGAAASATTAGTVTTNAQPNITSTGTLTSLSVTGNISAGNVSATTFTGALSGAATSATTAGTVTTNAQGNITSVGTLTSVVVSGNVTSGNVITGNVLVSSIQSNRANVSVTTNTVIDQFVPATYSSAKYVVSASSANGYQSVEAILVHDGTDSFVTIYGSVCSNATADIVELSSNINGVSGNTTLYATSSGGTATVNLVATYLKT
jgi:hypothetical protein